jgi:DNA-binding LacI/PurR family transcriptional regulator
VSIAGARAAERLLALLDGESVGGFEDATPRLITRDSTARPPA